MTKPLTFEQRYERIEHEASDKFSTPDGGLKHFECYEYMAREVLNMFIEEKCREIPRLTKEGPTLATIVTKSGKLEPHKDLLTTERKMFTVHSARTLLAHAMESGHEGLISTAKDLLSGIYTELSPVRDTDFGHTMMLRDVKVLEEVSANKRMIKVMSQAGKEETRRQNQPNSKSPHR